MFLGVSGWALSKLVIYYPISVELFWRDVTILLYERFLWHVQTADGSDVTVCDFDIGAYAHQEVDRFAILLDAWSNEAAFLQSKKEVI